MFVQPDVPALSPAGENLVIEFEVGGKSGYNPRPEAPDCRYSGITTGIGYDWSTNSPGAAYRDWQSSIGDNSARRLAATHSYTGCKAKDHLAEVRDIITSWQAAAGVFDKIDVAREWARAQRALPGFDELRPNCQAALISLGFNRGWSMTGDNRREMRYIRDAVPHKDYNEIASQLRKMPRVWSGTSIYKGMYRRRNAEADLVLTP
jgi:GH24 family phage-related lysozyme (muramidase)